MYQEQCSEYRNGICSDYLVQFGTNFSLRHKTILEADLVRFIATLRSNTGTVVSPECSQIAIPFICQYVYPPCINDTSNQLITREQCNDVKDEVCAAEWLVAMAIFPGILPDCEILINQTLEDNPVVKQNDSNETFCIDQFDTYCDKLCVPSCEHFSLYDEATTCYRKAIDIIASIIGLIGGTLFIIIAVRRRKNL